MRVVAAVSVYQFPEAGTVARDEIRGFAAEFLDGGKPARFCNSDVFLDFGYVFFEGSLAADGVYRLKTFRDAPAFGNRRPVYVFNGIPPLKGVVGMLQCVVALCGKRKN